MMNLIVATMHLKLTCFTYCPHRHKLPTKVFQFVAASCVGFLLTGEGFLFLKLWQVKKYL
jgi:hypothetical protein